MGNHAKEFEPKANLNILLGIFINIVNGLKTLHNVLPLASSMFQEFAFFSFKTLQHMALSTLKKAKDVTAKPILYQFSETQRELQETPRGCVIVVQIFPNQKSAREEKVVWVEMALEAICSNDWNRFYDSVVSEKCL